MRLIKYKRRSQIHTSPPTLYATDTVETLVGWRDNVSWLLQLSFKPNLFTKFSGTVCNEKSPGLRIKVLRADVRYNLNKELLSFCGAVTGGCLGFRLLQRRLDGRLSESLCIKHGDRGLHIESLTLKNFNEVLITKPPNCSSF